MHQTEHELGLQGVIRENEMEDLKRTFREEREDHEMARS
jgi:hypothetical protein